MKIWLTTDTHFGHEILKEYCGRPDKVEEKILKGLKTVREDDILIHLGDFCIGKDEFWHTEFMEKVKGKKWLIKGNHDHKSNSWYIRHGWDFVGKTMSDKFFGKRVMFSHIPQFWDGLYEANIHGHFHNSDHRRYEPELIERENGYQKLLALEYTNYLPVTLERFIK